MKRWIISGTLITVFFWLWPLRLFIKQNNCYFWTLEQLITRGGSVEWYDAKRWAGHHVIWIAPDGTPWEYTPPKIYKNTPWYKMLFYKGIVRQYRGKRKVRS